MARPGQDHARTSSASSGCRPPTPRSAATCAASACGRWTRSRTLVAAHEKAPERRLAQRALADELTGARPRAGRGRRAADEAADVLFGGDPLSAVRRRRSPSCGARWGRRPCPPRRSSDPVGAPGPRRPGGLERRRPPDPGAAGLPGQRAGARRAGDARCADLPRIDGRYLLLRRGKTSYHVVELAARRLTLAAPAPVESSFAPERPLARVSGGRSSTAGAERPCAGRAIVRSLTTEERTERQCGRFHGPALLPDGSKRYTHQFQSGVTPLGEARARSECRGG